MRLKLEVWDLNEENGVFTLREIKWQRSAITAVFRRERERESERERDKALKKETSKCVTELKKKKGNKKKTFDFLHT